VYFEGCFHNESQWGPKQLDPTDFLFIDEKNKKYSNCVPHQRKKIGNTGGTTCLNCLFLKKIYSIWKVWLKF